MKSILVVDDDAIFRAIMKRYLNQQGFNVLELDSGEDVIQLISTHEIEAIILDIIMDKHEGMETIIELTKLPKRPKIIAVSSNTLYLGYAIDFGVEAALTKPVSKDDLLGVLHQLAVNA